VGKKETTYDEETKKLGYSMPDYYDFCKTHYMRPLFYRMILWATYSFWAGFVSFATAFYAYSDGMGIGGKSGRTNDMWAMAFVSFTANIALHHAQIMLTIRNYTVVLMGWCVFSMLMFIPFTVSFVDFWVGIPLLHRQYSEILGLEAGMFWAILVLSALLTSLPILMFKAAKMVLYAPQFFK